MQETQKLFKSLLYDYQEGKFYRLKKDGSLDRQIFPDINNTLIYWCSLEKKNIKKKVQTLIWEYVNNEKLPQGFTAYFKDMNPKNLKANNIGIIKTEEYRKLKDALSNFNGAIKILPHKTNAFMYVIKYKQGGKYRTLVCQDIIHANRIKRNVLFKALKLLNKYFLSTS